MKNENPLLKNYVLPPFNKIQVQHIELAIDKTLQENRKELENLLENTKHYNPYVIYYIA